jgi:hypothetical protein
MTSRARLEDVPSLAAEILAVKKDGTTSTYATQ